jgi:hypothetical protein
MFPPVAPIPAFPVHHIVETRSAGLKSPSGLNTGNSDEVVLEAR